MNPNKRGLCFIAIVAAGIAGGCMKPDSIMVQRPARSILGIRGSVRAEDGHIPMLDELLEEINRRAPGFGGMFRSENKSLTIYVMPGYSPASVEAAARYVFSDFPWSQVSSVRVKTAQFEVLDLQAWRARVPEIAGDVILWSDFDEVSNVVRVGVDERANLEALRDRVAMIGAPREAIVFEHSARSRPAQYLSATHRPLVGGVQIGIYDSVIVNRFGAGQFGTCSLGANVRLSTDGSHEYFFTAAHCMGAGTYQEDTAIFGPNHGARIYQPDSSTSATLIANEYSVPDARSGLSGCPFGHTCKYSDAALFQYSSTTFSDFAHIAKDSSFSSTLGVLGSGFRVDSFHVVSDIPESSLLAANTTPGQYDTYIHKVGIATGWTWGPIIRTCANGYYYPTKTLLCQYGVAAQANYGDSGGSVFWWVCCNLNEAWLGGLLSRVNPGASYDFSSITGIKNDFANIVSY